jgi:hypothetical protein
MRGSGMTHFWGGIDAGCMSMTLGSSIGACGVLWERLAAQLNPDLSGHTDVSWDYIALGYPKIQKSIYKSHLCHLCEQPLNLKTYRTPYRINYLNFCKTQSRQNGG